MLGTHLMIDGALTKCPQGWMVSSFLNDVTKIIEMTIIGGPFVIDDYPNGNITGILIIAESHIKVEIRMPNIWVDIFSCKSFDSRACFRYVEASFGMKKSKTYLIYRNSS